MRKLIYLMSLTTLGIFLIFIYAGCSEESSPVATTTVATTTVATTTVATTGTIGGVISLPVGAGGDITNTRVATYQSFDDWLNDRVLTAVATDVGGNYMFPNVTPSTYYLDAWKDNNNNTFFDSGDFWGVYGSGTYPNYQPSPFSVAAGQQTTITATIFIIP